MNNRENAPPDDGGAPLSPVPAGRLRQLRFELTFRSRANSMEKPDRVLDVLRLH